MLTRLIFIIAPNIVTVQLNLDLEPSKRKPSLRSSFPIVISLEQNKECLRSTFLFANSKFKIDAVLKGKTRLTDKSEIFTSAAVLFRVKKRYKSTLTFYVTEGVFFGGGRGAGEHQLYKKLTSNTTSILQLQTSFYHSPLN